MNNDLKSYYEKSGSVEQLFGEIRLDEEFIKEPDATHPNYIPADSFGVIKDVHQTTDIKQQNPHEEVPLAASLVGEYTWYSLANPSTIPPGASGILTASNSAGTFMWDHGLSTGASKVVSPVCTSFVLGDQCSGNSQEIRSYTINFSPAGSFPVELTYRSHERAGIVRMRINGGVWQSYNVAQTPVDLSYVKIPLGSHAFNSGDNLLELASGEGFVCFRELCVKGSDCTPPLAPALSVNTVVDQTGQTALLFASGCTGTVTWSHDLGTGTSKVVNRESAPVTYTATCTVNGCTSQPASATVPARGIQPPPCFSLSDQCSGNSQEIRIYSLNLPSGGTFPVELTYRSHERAGIVRMRINRGVWQTFDVAMTPGDLSYVKIPLGSHTFSSGDNRLELASGEGFVCFRELCVKGGDCTPPPAPTLSVNTVVDKTGQTALLLASGCTGTVTWSHDLGTGTSKVVNRESTPITYTATCTVNGCTSEPASVTVEPAHPCTRPGFQCSGNSQEIRTVFLSLLSGGSRSVTLTYRAHERPGIGRIRINGGTWQSFDLPQTPSDLSLMTRNIGVFSFHSGTNSVELASGQGYICFVELCAELIGTRTGVIEESVTDSPELTVSPNPNNGEFEASFYVEPGRRAILSVSDLQGRGVWQKSLEGKGEQRETILLPAQAVGTYLLILRKEATTSLSKTEYKKVLVVK